MTEARMTVGGKEIRYVVEEDGRIPVDSAEQIPHFESEAEEQAFWATHTLSGNYWRNGGAQSEELRRATETVIANNRRHQELSNAMWDELAGADSKPKLDSP